jgi:hypothetical protein
MIHIQCACFGNAKLTNDQRAIFVIVVSNVKYDNGFILNPLFFNDC